MERLEKNNIIKIRKHILSSTLKEIKLAGELNHERLVLWLSGKNCDTEVAEVFVPQQINESDYFYLPEESMSDILRYLRQNSLKILAQVHSHPKIAFHSGADSKWAIIRQVGAMSFVVPYFGAETEENNFFEDVALFRLTENNEWGQVTPQSKVKQLFRIYD